MLEALELLEKEVKRIRKTVVNLRYQSLYARADYREAEAERFQHILNSLQLEYEEKEYEI